ncbi:MAG: DUF421 domain-containing protein [Bacilli bacterium]|nr:DUF421 domain-containing protein [Bacilli bacterium]
MYSILIGKTFFLYVFIIIVYRIMGKKEVSQLGVGDLIVTILIAELAAISIQEPNTSIMKSIISISVLVISEISISYISLRSNKIRKLVDGVPSVIIKNGKIKFSIMSKLRYTLDDLVIQLRSKGIKNINEVDYAILETNGELSVFQDTKDYPMPIILDGMINYDVLAEIKKNEIEIMNLLKEKQVKLQDVFYAIFLNKKLYIIKKDELI